MCNSPRRFLMCQDVYDRGAFKEPWGSGERRHDVLGNEDHWPARFGGEILPRDSPDMVQWSPHTLHYFSVALKAQTLCESCDK